MDLEQRVIEVTELVQGDPIKLKDEHGKTYNIRKKLASGGDTKAFVSYKEMGMGEISGKLIDIRFDRFKNQHGTESRGIKMIEWAKPLQQTVEKIQEDTPPKPPPIFTGSSVDWDAEVRKSESKAPDWDAINAEKTKDIHKGMSFNKCMDYFISIKVDLETIEGFDRLRDLITKCRTALEEDK